TLSEDNYFKRFTYDAIVERYGKNALDDLLALLSKFITKFEQNPVDLLNPNLDQAFNICKLFMVTTLPNHDPNKDNESSLKSRWIKLDALKIEEKGYSTHTQALRTQILNSGSLSEGYKNNALSTVKCDYKNLNDSQASIRNAGPVSVSDRDRKELEKNKRYVADTEQLLLGIVRDRVKYISDLSDFLLETLGASHKGMSNEGVTVHDVRVLVQSMVDVIKPPCPVSSNLSTSLKLEVTFADRVMGVRAALSKELDADTITAIFEKHHPALAYYARHVD
ncbi:unnamed protein product, partial [marine sediment metagenome]